jgi:FdhD protein
MTVPQRRLRQTALTKKIDRPFVKRCKKSKEAPMNIRPNHQVTYWDKTARKITHRDLIREEPLSIRVQGKPYSVILRTPGDEIAHVAGFCLAEGIIDTLDDCVTIAYCDDFDTNVVTITLKTPRLKKIADHLDRRGFISQTSCGICGKELVEELFQWMQPLDDNLRIDIHTAYSCLKKLSGQQPLRIATRATHAAVLYTADSEPLSSAEDVGRHNALDKAIGKVLLGDKLDIASLVILSSRISYELVQKAARAQIPVIIAASRPTALALDLASQLNITLATQSKGEGLYIFCGEHRLIGSGEG